MIDSLEKLRSTYPPAKERSVRKQLDHLDRHCLRFVALSPKGDLIIGGVSASFTGGAGVAFGGAGGGLFPVAALEQPAASGTHSTATTSARRCDCMGFF